MKPAPHGPAWTANREYEIAPTVITARLIDKTFNVNRRGTLTYRTADGFKHLKPANEASR